MESVSGRIAAEDCGLDYANVSTIRIRARERPLLAFELAEFVLGLRHNLCALLREFYIVFVVHQVASDELEIVIVFLYNNKSDARRIEAVNFFL